MSAVGKFIRVAAVAILIIAPGVSYAMQPEADALEPPADRQTDTPADRFGFVAGEQLQVTTGTEDDNLTFRIALPTGPAMASRFSLAVATPIHDDDQAKPASLDALANGTRITLSWGYFAVNVGRPGREAQDIERDAQARCRAEDENPDRCRNTGYAVYHYSRRDNPRYQRLIGTGATDFGIDATLGINDFEWIDPVTLLPQEARETDWSVTGHVAHFLSGSQTALTGSISY